MPTVPLPHRRGRRWSTLLPAAALVLGAAATSAPATASDEDADPTSEAAYSETYVDADAVGSDVTLEAEVYVETEDPALTTGTVTFTQDGTVVGSAPISTESDVADGTAVNLVVRDVPVGRHSYVAQFTPATAGVEASSDTDALTVRGTGSSTNGRASGRVSIQVDAPSSVRRGKRATVVATLTSARGGAPTGSVSATTGRKTYRATLRAGSATFRIPIARRTTVVLTYPGTPIARRTVTIGVRPAARRP